MLGVKARLHEGLFRSKSLIKHKQQLSVSAKESSFQMKSPVYKGEKLRKELLVFILEDGVLRVGGRLGRAAMPDEAKHPVILAKNLHISDLIPHHMRKQTGHGGRNYMLSKLHQRYWIPRSLQ